MSMATCRIRNTDWHYAEKGQGLSLVLIHGFPLDHRIWKAQVEDLGDCCRVIAPDLKGFGKSLSTEAFTMESLADELHQLLQQIGALPCVLAGLSMGGYIGLAFAEKFAADLKGLILIDSKAEADPQVAKENRQKAAELAMHSGSVPVAAQMLPKMLAPSTIAQQPEVVKTLQQIMETVPPVTIANASYAMRDRPDRTALLSRLTIPSLIVLGDVDALIPLSMGQAMQQLMPAGQLVVIPGAGHMPCIEQPAALNDALRRFMAATADAACCPCPIGAGDCCGH
jgi:pimeloyl-ACP methyl ester carboxylesterase